MKRLFLLSCIFLIHSYSKSIAQSFAPKPSENGTIAISKDSSIFVAWANKINLQRGYLDISNKTLGKVTFGQPENALGKAQGNSVDVVSLGDSGIAILEFNTPITNKNGFDFAIFENGFADDYMEFAFVEVSSDGEHFVRFLSISEVQTVTQIGNFEYSDCRMIHNLAGKYRQGFGTPFDLEELKDSSSINIEKITHLKLVDVVGSINPLYGSKDSKGNLINDPWPSNFESGGFDLDAVGVIHQFDSALEELNSFNILYKNLTDKYVFQSENPFLIQVFSPLGQLINSTMNPVNNFEINKINSDLLYMIKIQQGEKLTTYKIIL